jgi:phosphoribosyl 1,2-cyclic phosphodiesterase
MRTTKLIEFESIASSSAGCCYVLRDGGVSPLLIECGVRLQVIAEALNFGVSQLAGVLISHSHGDHCKSAKDLYRRGVNVYGSKETLEKLDIDPSFLGPLIPHKERQIGAWIVKPFEAIHDCPGTLGFLIQGPSDEKLVYLTDSAYSLYRFDDVTVWAVEANYSSEIIRDNTAKGSVNRGRFAHTVAGGHMSIDTLCEMLKANDLTAAREIHLLHLSLENSNEEEFKKAVMRATGKPVFVAPRGRT